jgi:hypothetical protein
MDFGFFIDAAICVSIGAIVYECIVRKRFRWNIADMLTVTTLVAVMLAIGRILKSV